MKHILFIVQPERVLCMCLLPTQVVPLSPSTGVIEMVPATSLSDLLVSEHGLHMRCALLPTSLSARHASKSRHGRL